MLNHKKFTSIELFAGAGGLAIGLEKANFKHVGLVEIDKDSSDTLKKNRPMWNVINDDIKNITTQNLEKLFKIKKGDLDLLSGGAPCQSFSYAGKRQGINDNRGTLFYQYALFLKYLKPKCFLFENVKGLLSLDSGKAFNLITKTFEEEGYSIQYKILNALDYQVAQKRERLIIIGIRNDLSSILKFNFPKPIQKRLVLRDVLFNISDKEGAQYSEQKKAIFSLVPPGGYWKNISPVIAKDYMKTCWDMGGGRTGILRRLSLDEPSLTILTTPQMKQTDRCHPIEVRPLSIRESARIQSFPDTWEFCGKTNSKYRQIGNAVPCNLGYYIGKEIFNMLNANDFSLNFISQNNFEQHVLKTIKEYKEILNTINLKNFNSNLIDPIKLLFDKAIFKKTYNEIISLEIQRQRDKSNNNAIGYFHQNIFKYITNCQVPEKGWDIKFDDIVSKKKYYVEMKNKHNTMNSSSTAKTYMKFQDHLLKNSEDICALVEVISKKSQNIKWIVTIDGQKMSAKENLRKISIDKFYEIVTGDKNAFYKMCLQLPKTIDKLIKQYPDLTVEPDTVVDEIKKINSNLTNALYLLAFSTYEGFDLIK